MNQLSLCSGRTRREGWTTLDARPGADITATIPPLPVAVYLHSWHVVELIHGIEHFTIWDARELLKELYHVIAVNGLLILEQPDIFFVARRVANATPANLNSRLAPMYGDPKLQSRLHVHQWGYTPESLRAELIAAGWREDSIRQAQPAYHIGAAAGRDFRLEARK